MKYHVNKAIVNFLHINIDVHSRSIMSELQGAE